MGLVWSPIASCSPYTSHGDSECPVFHSLHTPVTHECSCSSSRDVTCFCASSNVQSCSTCTDACTQFYIHAGTSFYASDHQFYTPDSHSESQPTMTVPLPISVPVTSMNPHAPIFQPAQLHAQPSMPIQPSLPAHALYTDAAFYYSLSAPWNVLPQPGTGPSFEDDSKLPGFISKFDGKRVTLAGEDCLLPMFIGGGGGSRRTKIASPERLTLSIQWSCVHGKGPTR